MTALNPYLNFPGTCEDAMKFYAAVFGGELSETIRYGTSQMPVDEDKTNWVMHSELKAEGIHLMAADNAHGPCNNGNMVILNLAYSDPEKQAGVFAKLSEGGKVTMALEKSPWGAIFGMCTDKYGIHWMTNCEEK